ncbi:hypothetical protein [Kribbia dieselivorans]|nr:hypothetical protein [Kribbia dieselivorans]
MTGSAAEVADVMAGRAPDAAFGTADAAVVRGAKSVEYRWR